MTTSWRWRCRMAPNAGRTRDEPARFRALRTRPCRAARSTSETGTGHVQRRSIRRTFATAAPRGAGDATLARSLRSNPCRTARFTSEASPRNVPRRLIRRTFAMAAPRGSRRRDACPSASIRAMSDRSLHLRSKPTKRAAPIDSADVRDGRTQSGSREGTLSSGLPAFSRAARERRARRSSASDRAHDCCERKHERLAREHPAARRSRHPSRKPLSPP